LRRATRQRRGGEVLPHPLFDREQAILKVRTVDADIVCEFKAAFKSALGDPDMEVLTG